jgi:hypothetical protein
MGFDPLNEPEASADNILRTVENIRQGFFDKTLLQPMFTRLYNEAYKVAGNNSIMVFEPNLQMLNY